MKNYVKEYKSHKVPEGATHYGAETEDYNEGFYKNGYEACQGYEGCEEYAIKLNCSDWIHTGLPIPSHAIELPLAEEEFEPAGGEWFISSDGEKLFYVGVNHIGLYVCNTSFNQLVFLRSFDGCKPLQSERDIEIENVVKLWEKEGQPKASISQRSSADIVASLYDAGLLK